MLESLPPELFACGGVCDPDKLPQDSQLEVEQIITDRVSNYRKFKFGFWEDEAELRPFRRYAESIYRRYYGDDYFEPGRPQPAFMIFPPEVRLMNSEP